METVWGRGCVDPTRLADRQTDPADDPECEHAAMGQELTNPMREARQQSEGLTCEEGKTKDGEPGYQQQNGKR